MARVTKQQQQQGPKRAAIYCRVSTAAQAEDDKVSLTEQEADCRAYCESKGYEVVTVYTDVKTGTTSKRPDFERLIAAASEEAFDLVVCWKVDRLGRGLYPMARLLEALEPAGITIEAVKEQVDQRFLGIYASVGKIELDNIKERTTNARRAYARQGLMLGGIPAYGYRRGDDGRPELEPIEASALVEAAERYAAGELPISICRDFRGRNIPTRLPKTAKNLIWRPEYLNRLFADEAYTTGKRGYGGETVQYPPLFTPELWQALKARREANTRNARRNTKEPYLLQHLLYCKECELAFTGTTSRSMRQRTPAGYETRPRRVPLRRYICGGCRRYEYACRSPQWQKAGPIEDAVWQTLAAALQHPEQILTGIKARMDGLVAEERDGDAGEADKRLAQLKWERLEHLRQSARGKLDDAELDFLLSEIDAQVTYWQERAEAERRLSAELDARRRLLTNAATYLEEIRTHVAQRLEALAFEERRQLVLALCERVWMDRDGNLSIDGILGGQPVRIANQPSPRLVG